MMQFERDRWERQFQLGFNRGACRTDLLYSACLAAFGLAALYRLASIPGSTAAQLATAGVLAYAPLLLLLTSVWPHGYIQHRQPLVAAMKVYAAFVATLLPAQHAGAFGRGGAGGAMGPAEALLHAGASFATQLMLHALGLQTTGAWLVVSQGFVVAASAHSAARACDAHLTGAVADLLRDSPHLLAAPWLPAGLADVPPAMLCKAYALGTQVLLGFCLTTAVGLVAEWHLRAAFAAKHALEPPPHCAVLAASGCFLAMLFLLLRVAVAAALLPPAGAVAGAAVAGVCGGGTCPANL